MLRHFLAEWVNNFGKNIMSNKIELKSISELSGMKFFIPDYQRGYRWTKELVKDLLDDIHEFIEKKHGGFYCIQPLVVKKNIIRSEEYCEKLKILNHEDNNLIEYTEKLIDEYSQWEVIDGQQRLTTIFILLKLLSSDKENNYSIEYETRTDSKTFLEKINKEDKDRNIDYHHIYDANIKIKAWFDNKDDEYKKTFLNNLLENVKFIWYESVNEDPIKVFTRLNIGKISLTNSELIKALFLNKSNFKTSDLQRIRLQQQEIASEWDKIEYRLQSDELWLFLNAKGYDKPTRIDLILDLICEKNKLKLNEEYNTIGKDEYRTFRYFYTWFKKEENPNIKECWGKIKTIFQTFNEWFNDLELYHYIGFLVEQGEKTSNILDEWKKKETKQMFLDDYIKEEINKKLKNCSDLNKEYDVNGSPKTQCRPLLLLHNIQTVINQGKEFIKNEKYKLPVFYKFPFHLFKNEVWNIEHIASNTDNSLENEKEQKEWIKAAYIGVSSEELKGKIKSFINQDEEVKTSFEELQEEITNSSEDSKLNEEDKNKIWNFCLLDESTNKGYGNSIFSAKRRAIIGKDQGKKIEVDDELKIEENSGKIAFIPPSTINVFMKYYNASTNNLQGWDIEDAKAYKTNIEHVLKEFLLETKSNEEQ